VPDRHWQETTGTALSAAPWRHLFRAGPRRPSHSRHAPTTLPRARRLGLDPAAFLADNNSTEFFEKLGDLLTPGPTLTNVNDLRAILVDSP